MVNPTIYCSSMDVESPVEPPISGRVSNGKLISTIADIRVHRRTYYRGGSARGEVRLCRSIGAAVLVLLIRTNLEGGESID